MNGHYRRESVVPPYKENPAKKKKQGPSGEPRNPHKNTDHNEGATAEKKKNPKKYLDSPTKHFQATTRQREANN